MNADKARDLLKKLKRSSQKLSDLLDESGDEELVKAKDEYKKSISLLEDFWLEDAKRMRYFNEKIKELQRIGVMKKDDGAQGSNGDKAIILPSRKIIGS